ncbi:MAG: hypothetical protein NWE89_00190 [Candidatus Bathyarchaeota archaeon]|nr:hypothetical protein [Candidatus Bathyarchaeota archaeon]
MIVCGHSKIELKDEGWSVGIPSKVGGVIGLFPGQTLFGYIEPDSGRLLLSPLKLTSNVSYFRMFLDDVRGSLASVTKLFSDRDLNILSGGAFGFSNIWISEFLVDFSGSNVSPDEIINELSGMGGFVTSREITELFPVSFNLSTTYKVKEADGGVMVTSDSAAEAQIKRAKYAVIKAWPRIRAIFMDFHPPETRLVHIKALIKDVPGSLTNITETIGTQVNLNALDELHHDELSTEWNGYGELVVGDVEELIARAEALDTVISFEAKLLS